MWSYKKLLKIKWTDEIYNEVVLRRMKISDVMLLQNDQKFRTKVPEEENTIGPFFQSGYRK